MPDPLYNSMVVTKVINQIMKRGKKNAATKIVYGAFDVIKEKTQKDPLQVFDTALENARPLLEVKSQRIGGATYQVPRPVVKERRCRCAGFWMPPGAKRVCR